jgi:hypothetical protein
MLDRTRSLDSENGIVLSEDGPGLFSDVSPSVSGFEVEGDRLIDSQGRAWVFSGGGWVIDATFSVSSPREQEVWRVPTAQNMLQVGALLVEGELQIDGGLFLEEFSNSAEFPAENFSFRRVDPAQLVRVDGGQQMLVVPIGGFEVEGEIQVDGQLILDDFDVAIEQQPIVSPPDNFSYKEVLAGLDVTVPTRQQMIVDGLLTVEGGLILEGELSLISDERDDGLSPFRLVVGETFRVPEKKQLLIVGVFELEGTLEVEGNFALGA